MIKENGSYISWSVSNLVAGLTIGAFGFFTSIDYPFYLLIVFAMLVVLNIIRKRNYKPDERESYLLLKVQAESGLWSLVMLPIFHPRLGDDFYAAIWGVYLFFRGCFGLYYFLRE